MDDEQSRGTPPGQGQAMGEGDQPLTPNKVLAKELGLSDGALRNIAGQLEERGFLSGSRMPNSDHRVYTDRDCSILRAYQRLRATGKTGPVILDLFQTSPDRDALIEHILTGINPDDLDRARYVQELERQLFVQADQMASLQSQQVTYEQMKTRFVSLVHVMIELRLAGENYLSDAEHRLSIILDNLSRTELRQQKAARDAVETLKELEEVPWSKLLFGFKKWKQQLEKARGLAEEAAQQGQALMATHAYVLEQAKAIPLGKLQGLLGADFLKRLEQEELPALEADLSGAREAAAGRESAPAEGTPSADDQA